MSRRASPSAFVRSADAVARRGQFRPLGLHPADFVALAGLCLAIATYCAMTWRHVPTDSNRPTNQTEEGKR